MEADRKLLKKMEAGADLKSWLSLSKHTTKMIERTEESIEHSNTKLAELKKNLVQEGESVLRATERLNRLSK